MRKMPLIDCLLAFAFCLTGCRSGATPEGEGRPTPAPSPPPAPAAQSSEPIPPAPQRAIAAKKNRQIAQLDLGSEGGTRDGSYSMWVHVSEDGEPVRNLRVLAYNAENHVAATARTNEDGDARLLVQIAVYRIAASHGKRRAEQTVAYRPGTQCELQLKR